MSWKNSKKRRKTTPCSLEGRAALTGVRYLRRLDLRDMNGKLDGVFHILDPKGRFGICYNGQERVIGHRTVERYEAGFAPPPELICQVCFASYLKSERSKTVSTTVWSTTDIANISGVNFIREEAVMTKIQCSEELALEWSKDSLAAKNKLSEAMAELAILKESFNELSQVRTENRFMLGELEEARATISGYKSRVEYLLKGAPGTPILEERLRKENTMLLAEVAELRAASVQDKDMLRAFREEQQARVANFRGLPSEVCRVDAIITRQFSQGRIQTDVRLLNRDSDKLPIRTGLAPGCYLEIRLVSATHGR